MGILWSLILGGVAGWLAGRFMKGRGYGVVMNVVLGLVGGLVGGWVFAALGLGPTKMLGQLIAATVGAVLLIALVRAIRK